LVILLISIFVALCVKLDPSTHKGMHSVSASILGVTLIETSVVDAHPKLPIGLGVDNRVG
jgi:hypothetical protein